MYTVNDVREATGLASYEKVLIMNEDEWISLDYDNMNIDDLCNTDTAPMYTTTSMNEIREERARMRRLDALLTILERMNKGMALIQDLTTTRNKIREEYYTARDAFSALMGRLEYHQNRYDKLSDNEAKKAYYSFRRWKEALWVKAKPLNQIRKDKGAELGAVNKKLEKYWSHWKALQTQARELGVWADYYRLLNEEITPYWTTTDNTDIDSCTAQTDDALEYWKQERLDCERDAHIREQLAYEQDVHINWTPTQVEAEQILCVSPF